MSRVTKFKILSLKFKTFGEWLIKRRFYLLNQYKNIFIQIISKNITIVQKTFYIKTSIIKPKFYNLFYYKLLIINDQVLSYFNLRSKFIYLHEYSLKLINY